MALSGKTGKVTNSGATEVREWSVTEVGDPLDVTSFDDAGWRNFVLGLQGATGSFVAFGDRPVIGSVSGLQLDEGLTTGDLRISGDALINSIETGVAVDGSVQHSCDFTFKGEVTVGTVP